MMCAAIIILNLTSFKWDIQLSQVINRGIEVCAKKEMCVSKVVRTEERVFRVFCRKLEK